MVCAMILLKRVSRMEVGARGFVYRNKCKSTIISGYKHEGIALYSIFVKGGHVCD